MGLQSYKKLHVWQRSIPLVKRIYEITASFPKEELYGLTSQIRRSAVSLPSKLAEGAGRDSTKDFLRFLAVSYGSLAELETQLLIAKELSLLSAEDHDELATELDEIGRMMNGLKTALRQKLTTDH